MMRLKERPFILIVLISLSFTLGLAQISTNGSNSNEFLIDTSIVYASARFDQKSVSIAYDGFNYFVVWQDERNGSNYDIFGARLAQDGASLDSASIIISTSPFNELSPAIAFNGINYLVVWTDDRSGSFDIYGTRINQSGIVLDTNNIVISSVFSDQQFPSIAVDGTNYLVVWQDNRNGLNYDIYGTRVNQNGEVLDPTGIPISTATNNQQYPSVAFDGTNYLAVWQDKRAGYPDIDIYGTRINQAGTILDPDGIPVSTAQLYQEFPAVAFDGINYLVVWQDGSGASYDIYGRRVNQNGIILDTICIGISTSICGQYCPSVAFDGTNYLVVWHDNRGISYDIYGARVNQTGAVLDPNGIQILIGTNGQKYPSVIFGEANYLVAGQSEINNYLNNIDIYGSRVNQSGIMLDTNAIVLSTEASNQQSSSAAFGSTNYLVIWQDSRGNNYDIYGARLNQQGTVLDQTPIEISNSELQQLNPSVTFGETSYFVVWQDERNGGYDIYGTRVTQNGIVLEPNGIPLSTAAEDQSSPCIAFDGINYLAVWDDYRSGYSKEIYGARISQDGIVLEPDGIRIAWGSTIDKTSPAVAFDGTNYLVVWEEYSDSNTMMNIAGARINTSGTIIDPFGFRISFATGNQRNPSLSFDGTNYLIVWDDYRNGLNADIYGARVTTSRVVLDPNGIAITTTINDQEYPSIAFDGTYYLVVWQENQTGYEWDIYGARLSPAGILGDTFSVSNQSRNQLLPALIHGIGNQILITYSGFTSLIQGKVYNSIRIWGKFYPFEEITELKTYEAISLTPKIYPNPAKGVMRVHGPLSVTETKIFDVSGKLVKVLDVTSVQGHKQELKISLKGISPGIYFLRLGKETKKFLVVK
jgi:hypothetical protein